MTKINIMIYSFLSCNSKVDCSLGNKALLHLELQGQKQNKHETYVNNVKRELIMWVGYSPIACSWVVCLKCKTCITSLHFNIKVTQLMLTQRSLIQYWWYFLIYKICYFWENSMLKLGHLRFPCQRNLPSTALPCRTLPSAYVFFYNSSIHYLEYQHSLGFHHFIQVRSVTNILFSTLGQLTLYIEFCWAFRHAKPVLQSACDQSRIFWESLSDCQSCWCSGRLNLWQDWKKIVHKSFKPIYQRYISLNCNIQ